eukprot:6030741-Prymnesium_polylepis.1
MRPNGGLTGPCVRASQLLIGHRASWPCFGRCLTHLTRRGAHLGAYPAHPAHPTRLARAVLAVAFLWWELGHEGCVWD